MVKEFIYDENIDKIENIIVLLEYIIENLTIIATLNYTICNPEDNNNYCENECNTIEMYKLFLKYLDEITYNDGNINVGQTIPTDIHNYENGDLFFCTTTGNLYKFVISTKKIYTRVDIYDKVIKEFIELKTYPYNFSPITRGISKKAHSNYKILKKNINNINHIDKIENINAHNTDILRILKMYRNILKKKNLHL